MLEVQEIEINISTGNAQKLIVLQRSVPKYWGVDLNDFEGIEQVLAFENPENDARFIDITSGLLPINWNNESYKKTLLFQMDKQTKEFIYEYFDSDGRDALIFWLNNYSSNALAVAMIQAITHWLSLAWRPYELIKISANNGGYITENDLDLSKVVEVPCKFKNVKYVLFPYYAQADPTAQPPSNDPQYYIDWIANNP